MGEFNKLNIQVIAAFADSLDDASKMKEELKLSFKVGWGLIPQEVSTRMGAFYDEKRNILHPTGYIINPGGKIVFACYSTGSIGCFTAADTLGSILYRMSM